MKIYITILLLLFTMHNYSQCDIKTTNRPDGITMKYFTPKPVARAAKHEAGLSLYYNVQEKQYTLTIFVLQKESNSKELEGNLIIQTTNTNGISLKPYLHKMIEMNGQDVATSIYYLEQSDVDELKKYALKTLAFTIDSQIIGLTVTENPNLLQNEFACFNDMLDLDENKAKSSDDKFLQDLDREYYNQINNKSNSNLTPNNAFNYEQHQIDFDSSGETEVYYENNISYDEKPWYSFREDTIIKIIVVIIYLGLGVLIVYGFKK